jgi:biopolymer transport protein ExbB
MEQNFGFAHFIQQTDLPGKGVLGILFLLSIASWYLIVIKGMNNFFSGRLADRYLDRFWKAETLKDIRNFLEQEKPDNILASLTVQAIDAIDNCDKLGPDSPALAGGTGELVIRVLRNGAEQEAARVENGLTLLASAGSAAPYIGLLGTVWSIYHALVNIGLSGQGTLDKVAAPVGEALLMTAIGLAVAIPAVLAYNSFSRRNRLWLARLDGFSHDLYVLVTVGSRIQPGLSPGRESKSAESKRKET